MRCRPIAPIADVVEPSDPGGRPQKLARSALIGTFRTDVPHGPCRSHRHGASSFERYPVSRRRARLPSGPEPEQRRTLSPDAKSRGARHAGRDHRDRAGAADDFRDALRCLFLKLALLGSAPLLAGGALFDRAELLGRLLLKACDCVAKRVRRSSFTRSARYTTSRYPSRRTVS